MNLQARMAIRTITEALKAEKDEARRRMMHICIEMWRTAPDMLARMAADPESEANVRRFQIIQTFVTEQGYAD